jgi:hypothetical protein
VGGRGSRPTGASCKPAPADLPIGAPSVGLPALVVLAGVAPRPATSRGSSWRGPAQRRSAGVAPCVRGHRGCREEAVAPAMGAQPWQAPAKAQATVSRHKLHTRTNTVGATLLSFDDLVPGLAGAPPTASPRALPAPSPPPARTGSPSEKEVTSKCCHDGLIRLFSTSRPLRRRETR